MDTGRMPWRLTKGQKRAAGIITVVVVLLFTLSILGNVRITGYLKASMEESIHQYERKLASEEALLALEESMAEETAVHEISLTYMEEQLLNLLVEKMAAGDREGAAWVLNENVETLQTLFFDKLADEFCLFDGMAMTDQTDGHGLVFQKAGTVFYGQFKDGKPEGQCVALQAIHLEEGNRYDYSVGTWIDGVMEGNGECGYNYYGGVTGDGAKETVKTGKFSGNLMEGEITYTSVNADGEKTAWTMTVADGVIVPDERWIYEKDSDGTETYRLMADTDDVHAYVIEAGAIAETRWKNMIEWGD